MFLSFPAKLAFEFSFYKNFFSPFIVKTSHEQSQIYDTYKTIIEFFHFTNFWQHLKNGIFR
jgi:hypothetical protein